MDDVFVCNCCGATRRNADVARALRVASQRYTDFFGFAPEPNTRYYVCPPGYQVAARALGARSHEEWDAVQEMWWSRQARRLWQDRLRAGVTVVRKAYRAKWRVSIVYPTAEQRRSVFLEMRRGDVLPTDDTAYTVFSHVFNVLYPE